jgi:hypothetical protein
VFWLQNSIPLLSKTEKQGSYLSFLCTVFFWFFLRRWYKKQFNHTKERKNSNHKWVCLFCALWKMRHITWSAIYFLINMMNVERIRLKVLFLWVFYLPSSSSSGVGGGTDYYGVSGRWYPMVFTDPGVSLPLHNPSNGWEPASKAMTSNQRTQIEGCWIIWCNQIAYRMTMT